MRLRRASFSDRLLDYTVFDGHRHVEGWLEIGAISGLMLISETQRAKGIAGSLAEIGVHHGRLFIVLSLLRTEEERALAIDVFEDQVPVKKEPIASGNAVDSRQTAINVVLASQHPAV